MQLQITDITCIAASSIKPDNVFLIIQADAGAPLRYPIMGSHNMSAGDSMPLPPPASSSDDSDSGTDALIVEFEFGVVITAWDRDSFFLKGLDSPDYLFNINVCRASTWATTTYIAYEHNGAQYSFTRSLSN